MPLAEEGATEFTLSPGVPTLLRVTLGEDQTIEETYTLDYNELRVITFEVAAPQE